MSRLTKALIPSSDLLQHDQMKPPSWLQSTLPFVGEFQKSTAQYPNSEEFTGYKRVFPKTARSRSSARQDNWRNQASLTMSAVSSTF
jgi:hypothetical protein